MDSSRLEISWLHQALCQYVNPELFFPEKGQNAASAKRVCSHCPVWRDCRAYALAHEELVGVWGGLSERDRINLRTIGKRLSGRGVRQTA